MMIRNSNLVAIKFEDYNAKSTLLKHEAQIYRYLEGGLGIPSIKWFGLHEHTDLTYRYMVFDLLGKSLYDLKHQYKTLTLMVGFNQRDHGYMNPCADIINDNIVRNKLDYSENYKATPFYPTNPYDDKAHICNIQLKIDENNVLQMFTEEGEVIEDNMIVEFKYDVDDNYMWRWKPLRVRYDKTAQFRNGLPNYGNAYHVANSNWYSIHNPISKEMITTGENIPEDMSLDDVYYNRIKNKSNTRGLRDFHNLFVKRLLITRIAKRNDILIDLAVGKAGDFPKWIASKLKFVFGIDVSKDNIENKLDGACARYLNYAKETRNIPKVLFAHGDSSSSIANGDAFKNDLYKNIGNAVLGKGPKDEKLLGRSRTSQVLAGLSKGLGGYLGGALGATLGTLAGGGVGSAVLGTGGAIAGYNLGTKAGDYLYQKGRQFATGKTFKNFMKNIRK